MQTTIREYEIGKNCQKKPMHPVLEQAKRAMINALTSDYSQIPEDFKLTFKVVVTVERP